MNRSGRFWRVRASRVPHARGDEPAAAERSEDRVSAFPTPVGMNRKVSLELGLRRSVPHARVRIPTNVTACTDERDRSVVRASVGFKV